jgi:hypothetical protein
MPKTINKGVVAIPTAMIAVAASALLLMAPMLAAAASPHFVKGPTISKNSSGDLKVSFKAAGLGNSATDVFLTASNVRADLQCVNPGGNSPPPKTAEFGPVTGPTVTVQPRNGQITASPTLPFPASEQDLEDAADCPNPNWSVDVTNITYEDVELHIQQNGNDILTHDFGDVDP